jgi:death-on-curing protein
MTRYLTVDETLEMHRILINRYGGALGIRDRNGLESALYRPQSGYYSDIIAEAAALMESLVINHPFIDGNKRIAFAVPDVFLRINRFKIVEKPMRIHEKMIELLENQQFDFIHAEIMLREIVKPHQQ